MQGKLDEYPNLLILRAFTKIYAMPGLRLGYLLCSDEDLLDRISRSMQSWNVSIPAQMAGLAALNEDAYVKEARELIGKERAWMKAELEKQVLPYGIPVQIICSLRDRKDLPHGWEKAAF